MKGQIGGTWESTGKCRKCKRDIRYRPAIETNICHRCLIGEEEYKKEQEMWDNLRKIFKGIK